MGYHDIDFAPVEYFLPNTWAWVGYENWLPDGKRSLAPKLHCLVWYRKTVREDVEFEIETMVLKSRVDGDVLYGLKDFVLFFLRTFIFILIVIIITIR